MINYKLKVIKPLLISSFILSVGIIGFLFNEFHFFQTSRAAIKIFDSRYQIVKLKSVVLNTQSAQRGYLLTGNMVFIHNFNTGLKDIHTSLNMLERQALESLILANKIHKLKKLIEQNLNSINSEIQIEMNYGAYSPHLNSQKVALNSSALISKELDSIDKTLSQQSMDIQKNIHRTIQIAVGTAITLIIGILFILFRGYRHTFELFESAVKSQRDADSWGHEAYHDALTKLPNRRYFENHFKSVMSLAKRNKQSLALLFIDLDGFKRINDLYGHDVGDAALQYFAKKIKPELRAHDFLARLGGDEFAIVIQQNVHKDALYAFGQRIISSLAPTFEINGKICKLGASIGASVYPNDGEVVEDIIAAADRAMYKAKHNGKNMIVFA